VLGRQELAVSKGKIFKSRESEERKTHRKIKKASDHVKKN
jgi:hypothetical protein